MRSFVNSLIQGQRDDVFRIGYISDVHYDASVSSPPHLLDRSQALNYIANFLQAMEQWKPDLIIHAGDKTGASNGNASTQEAWYQATLDAVAASRFPVKDGISPGNHDPEYMSFAQLLSLHAGETWMESGALYGYWEQGGLGFVSLDAQYDTNDDSHLSGEHVGYGHINQDQLDWLEAKLATVNVPVIVNVHQIAAEFDTDLFYLTKATYHVDNRAALRTILEAAGNVIAVIQGHMHFARAQVINGIPYFTCPAIVPGSIDPIDEPETGKGEWLTIEVNKSKKTITWEGRSWISGVHETMYRHTHNWGAFAPVKNPLRVIDPVGFANVPNKRFSVKGWPSNLLLGDPRLSDTTMRIVGVAGTGQEIWEHTSQAGTFSYKFSLRVADNAVRAIRTSAASNAVHIVLEADGDISAYDGASLTVVSSYSVDTWYEFEIAVDVAADTFTLSIDGTPVATGFDFRATAAGIDALMLETATGTMFVDGLRIE